MGVLLVFSAFFSGVETAFFSLSRRQIDSLSKSTHRLHKLTGSLVERPSSLLSCLLFGNMAVNVLYFALSSVLALKLEVEVGVKGAAAGGLCAFALLVLFGEILPKTLAYGNSFSLSVLASLPVYVFYKVFRPILFVFRFAIIEPSLRLTLGPVRASKPISTSEFKLLVEQVGKGGFITAQENKLLTEVADIGFLKVRDCMCPRVDMIAAPVTSSSRTVSDMMLGNNITKLPVYAGEIDNILGLVYLRDVILRSGEPLSRLVRRANFVPEQKAADSLLEFFRRSRSDIAIVVDEYGGIAGSVRLEDLAAEVFGPIEQNDETEAVEQTGPFEFRISGNLSLHEWAGVFDISPEQSGITTIGGMVTALLGKIPKEGDVARMGNLSFLVEKVHKHRITTLRLKFEPISKDD